MANPVAAHTFDFGQVFLSTRDGAAPGSGTWSDPVPLFNYLDTATLALDLGELDEFSAGALSGDPSEPRGIIGETDAGLVFVGNGLPSTPQLITYTGQSGSGDGSGYWNTSQGAWQNAGSFFAACVNTGGSGWPVVTIIKSPDGSSPWTVQDGTNGPTGLSTAAGDKAAIQRVDNYIFVCTATDSSETTFAIYPLNMNTGLWESPSPTFTISNFQGFGIIGTDFNWSNGLLKFINGNFVVFYNTGSSSVSPVARLLIGGLGGSWSAEITLPGEHFANCLIDPENLGHILTYEGGTNDVVDYSTLDQNGTLDSVITTIPAPIGEAVSDGVGHCSIQNNMLFVPRDDSADFDNAVWVATLPVSVFEKELLPIPLGNANGIQQINNNPRAKGSGYALGDTGFIGGNSGINPAIYHVSRLGTNAILTFQVSATGAGGSGYSIGDQGHLPNSTAALYQVTSIGAGGAVTGIIILDPGAAFSVGTYAASTTTGGGSGLYVDVLSLYSGVTQVVLDYAGGGYSATNGAPTTAGYTQPGSGSGLTLDILAASKQYTPSCAYMMFPNGYSLNPTPPPPTPPPLGAFCPTAVSFLVGQPYSSQARAVGGTAPFTWALLSGALPPGLTLSTSGLLSGTPTTPGAYNFVLQATDANGLTIDTPTCPVTIANCPDAL